MCALCPPCLTWGQHPCAMFPVFQKLIIALFSAAAQFWHKWVWEGLRSCHCFLKSVADLWDLLSTIRLWKHLASASEKLNSAFFTIQRRNPTMGSMVLGIWKIFRECWKCEADSCKWSGWLTLKVGATYWPISLIAVSLSLLGWNGSALKPYLLYIFHFSQQWNG